MRKSTLLLAFVLMVSITATGEAAGDRSSARPQPVHAGAMQVNSIEIIYIVQRGDTLWDIARKHDVSLADLLAANNLPADAILAVGQKLRIPGASLGKTAVAAPAVLRHEVRAGDTLWDIAVAYGVTPDNIIAANKLANPKRLSVGQVLLIPGGVLPAAMAPTKEETPSPEPQPPTDAVATPAPEAPPPPEPTPAPEASVAASASTLPPEVAEWPSLVFNLINDKRAEQGLAPYTWSPILTLAAQAHADDCARRNFGSHVGSDGARLRERLQRAGYQPTAQSENWIYFYGPAKGVEWWYNEPPGRDPHRRNILSDKYTEIGVGVARGPNGHYYIIADFARP